MPIHRMGTVLAAVIALAAGLLAGCAETDRYRYETIQSEYGHLACAKPPAAGGSTGSSTVTACPLDRPVSLAEAVKIALANNPDLKIAAARIRQSRAAMGKAEAAYYPHLGLYTEYTHADAPSAYLFKTIDQRRLEPGTDFNQPGILDNFESGLNARYNLYNAGRDRLGHELARTAVSISQYDRQAVENRLVGTVIQAYYEALAAGDFIRIAEESVVTVEKELEIMQVRYKGGSALKSDLLSLEVRLARSREDVVRSRNRLQLALTGLANVLGVDPETTLQLRPDRLETLEVPASYDEGIAYGMKSRAEIGRIREQVRRARMGLDRSRSQRLPTVDLTGRWYLDDEKLGYNLDRDNWVVAVMANWNIFTGFSRKAEERKAEAVLAEILAADMRTGLDIQQDIKSAYLNLEGARARLEVARQSVARAEESLKLVSRQFEGGAATITRYLETELDRNHARIRAAAALYDSQKALADIGRAIGYWGRVKDLP